ncbi:rhodanese-like domain-containing protein, partial [Actinotalea sp. C106]|uniref:rhodanese-like domain-containing protein n=1 Tax=Actinotalea sp. C106 TaxID=2908644 RepID=UPI0020278029
LREHDAHGEGDDRRPVLVDVREASERLVATLPGDQHLPLGRFLDGTAWGELPPGRPVVLYCRSGARSAQAATLLVAAGWAEVRHLEGGILAWAAQVDQSLPSS